MRMILLSGLKKNPKTKEVTSEEIKVKYLYNKYSKKLSITNTNLTNDEKSFIKEFNDNCRVPYYLQLRVGARVMLTRNLDLSEGLVNGSCGIVESLDDGVFVKFDDIEESVLITNKKIRLSLDGNSYIERIQLPLILAYAVTIHKSQGLTLDNLVVNLKDVFDVGQSYVALSRVRSLEGLILEGYKSDNIKTSNDVKHFYEVLKEKGTFSQEDYPDYVIEIHELEQILIKTNYNKELLEKKKNYILDAIEQDEKINIIYLNSKNIEQGISEQIFTPKYIATGAELGFYMSETVKKRLYLLFEETRAPFRLDRTIICDNNHNMLF